MWPLTQMANQRPCLRLKTIRWQFNLRPLTPAQECSQQIQVPEWYFSMACLTRLKIGLKLKALVWQRLRVNTVTSLLI